LQRPKLLYFYNVNFLNINAVNNGTKPGVAACRRYIFTYIKSFNPTHKPKTNTEQLITNKIT